MEKHVCGAFAWEVSIYRVSQKSRIGPITFECVNCKFCNFGYGAVWMSSFLERKQKLRVSYRVDLVGKTTYHTKFVPTLLKNPSNKPISYGADQGWCGTIGTPCTGNLLVPFCCKILNKYPT